MLYPDDATKATIQGKARLSEKYNIINLGPALQFLGIDIQHDEIGTGTAISLGQKAFITTILNQFNMQNRQGALTPMDSNMKPDLGEDQGEKE
jgi:hypothetical protein